MVCWLEWSSGTHSQTDCIETYDPMPVLLGVSPTELGNKVYLHGAERIERVRSSWFYPVGDCKGIDIYLRPDQVEENDT